MTLEKTYDFENVRFSADMDSSAKTVHFHIENPEKKEIPETLVKYFNINEFSVDGLINHYLFAPHPKDLNDKYDCCGELINYENVNIEFFINRLAKELSLYSEDKVRELYNSDNKWILGRTIADLNQIILFFKFGLISMTEDPLHPLMWSHYAKNSGFVIQFKTSLLPNDFFGPFPITYSTKLESIDFSRYNPALCFLYQSNIKNTAWAYENEWRFLTYNRDGKYHPLYSSYDIKSRKYSYSQSSIERVILGYDFFDPKEIDYKNRTKEYDIIRLSNKKSRRINKLKRRFLHYLVKNNILCSQVVRNRYLFELKIVDIKIEQLSSNKFKIYNSFKTVY